MSVPPARVAPKSERGTPISKPRSVGAGRSGSGESDLDAALAAVDRTARPLDDHGTAAVVRTALTGTRDPSVRAVVADRVPTAVELVGDADASASESAEAFRRAIHICTYSVK